MPTEPKMTERQKYLFDLQGFVVVENVLTMEECDLAVEKIKERMKPMDKTPDGYDSNGTWFSAGALLDVGNPFTSLIDHPKTVSVLKEIISPKLRLESAYSFVRTKGCPPFEMHGGHAGGSVNFRYYVKGSRIFTGLTVISFTLQDIDEQDGGFACIPGSHKSDFSVPEDDRDELFKVDGPLVQNIASPKGSAIIFTETLAHGANTWQNNEPRYGLFYKYNDRSAIYHCQEIRRPSDRSFSFMSKDQKSYFNNAWQAFGPVDNPRNEKPEFGCD